MASQATYIITDKTVAFSGYRTSKLTDSSPSIPFEVISKTLFQRISTLITTYFLPLGINAFVCGMADGFDLIAGICVAEMKKEHPEIRLIAAVPYWGQKATKRNEAQSRFILDNSDMVIYACGSYQANCFLLRNDIMLNLSSTLVCYYDGQQGGTGSTVQKAKKLGKTVINLCLKKEAVQYNNNADKEALSIVKSVNITT